MKLYQWATKLEAVRIDLEGKLKKKIMKLLGLVRALITG
jgi:hypothetical protein